MKNITLIIPSYRNPKYLDLCLKSATENRADPNNKILVIIDGFMEESKAILDKYSDVLYLDLGTNHGMQYALNMGVMQAETKYVFIINDDNVMGREWDKWALESIKCNTNYDDTVVVTADQVEPHGPGMFDFHHMDFGKNVDDFDYRSWLDMEPTLRTPELTKNGHIFPFIMAKKHYMAVGGFDTFYNSPNCCDWDFFLKLELLDFIFVRSHQLHLYHFGSVATKKNSESQDFIERERMAWQTYEWKWGTPPYNGPDNTKIHPGGYRGFTHD